MRKLFLLIITFVVGFSFLATSTQAEDLSRFKGQTITVTCWSGPYTNDFKKGFVEPFMKASGARVVVSPGWSEFIAKIKASPEDNPPYDVFMADGWNYIAAMNIERLLPIRKENIPNTKDIFPELLKREPWVESYGVPFDGGLYVPVFAPSAIEFTPTAWKDFLRPELEGRLTMDKTFYYGLYANAFISDMMPGVEELYTEEGLDHIFKLSADLAGKVKKFYKGGAEFYSLLKTGEAAMGAYYSGGTISKMRKGMDVDFIFPEEGAVSWIGYLTVMKGTENRELAEAFINWCIDPENQYRFKKYQGNWTSNSKSKTPEDVKGKLIDTNEAFQNVTFFDWKLLNKHWSELQERWKKEVLTQAR